ncbi:conserved hypothetical protein [uncultured Desulfatiglans sp.]|nr:conserved hypothetical protein [uncultured Desulfatiglans sp.]
MYSIKTERLLLSNLKDFEKSTLKSMLSDPSVMKHLFAGRPMSSEEADVFIDNYFMKQNGNTGLGSVCDLDEKKFIGFAGIIPCEYVDTGKEFEFGFAFQDISWGKGYATEIGRAQIDYAFKHLDIDRLFALAHPNNVASNKVLLKLGMKMLKNIEIKERGERMVYTIERCA